MTSEVEISLQTSFKKVWIFSKFSEHLFWTKEVQIDTVPSFAMSLIHILRKKSFNLIWMIEEAKISLQTSLKKNDYASVAL